MSAERMQFPCVQCGKNISCYMEHYDKVLCGRCQKIHWALRPHRHQPLVAFPWPGTPAMLRFQQQQSINPSIH